ncbi:MAG: RNA polymerase subunit sigma-24 [Candidatus Dadabacteria bacterium]
MPENQFDMASLLLRVKAGDADASRDLVTFLYPLVIKIVRANLPRSLSEEDLAQEVFMRVFAHIEQYRGVVPFEHWVSRIALTTCINHLRAQKRRPELRWTDLSETEVTVLEGVMSAEFESDRLQAQAARELVNKLLDCLNPDDRLVIALLDLEQRSVSEISQITGWSRPLIKVRAFRARRKLRKYLSKLLGRKI